MAKTDSNEIWTTGRRKCAVARIRMADGSGKVTVNGRALEKYFLTDALRSIALEAMAATDTAGKYDVHVNVCGGGPAGQASAVRLGIARALITANADLRGGLKEGGFLTRDSRVKERKKYGQPGARKRFQYSKR